MGSRHFLRPVQLHGGCHVHHHLLFGIDAVHHRSVQQVVSACFLSKDLSE